MPFSKFTYIEAYANQFSDEQFFIYLIFFNHKITRINSMSKSICNVHRTSLILLLILEKSGTDSLF